MQPTNNKYLMPKQILKAHKIRLYPTDEQQIFFAKSFGCARFIWNKMLGDKIDHYKTTKTTLNNTPAQYKKEFPRIKAKLWEDRFWSQSFCLITTGGAPLEVIKQYIIDQGK